MIYLDHHAATPVDPRAREAMERARELGWANAASAHAAGRAARRLVEDARADVAAAIGAQAADVVLTSGGTEACNLGARGLVPTARRVLSTDVEHPAVSEALASSSRVTVTALGGRPPSPAELVLDDVDLACIQWVNHETGTVFDVAGYAARCRDAGVPLFVDATAALGKVPLDVTAVGATAMAFGSSKIGGPLGAGALWIARDAPLTPRQLGGGQERGRRAGTPDPIALAGFGAAARRVGERVAAMPALAALRDRLEATCLALGAVANGADGPRVATVTNVSVEGWRGSRLVAALDLEGLCASAGAACSSGVDGPSEVIAAMYPDAPWRAASSLRLSLGPSTTDDEITRAAEILSRVIRRKA